MENLILTQFTETEFRSFLKQSLKEILKDSSESDKSDDCNVILTSDQAATFLGVPKSTVYYYTCKKMIPFLKQGKRIYIAKADLIQWLKEGRQKTITERSSDMKSYLAEHKGY